jgi:nucleotide-binding universal stress UspA family protein
MHTTHVFPPRKILVPTDMSAASDSALKYARILSERFKAEVLVLHAHHVELPAYFSSVQVEDLKRELQRAARDARDYVRRQVEPLFGVLPEIEVIESPPVEAILDASRTRNADLVIMGMHGHRGWQRLWMGSVTEQVIRRSSLPVLAVSRPPSEAPVRRILCPANPYDAGKQALEYAAKIGKAFDAHLTVLHVAEPGDEPLACPLVDEPIKNSCHVEEIKLNGNAAKTIAEASNSLKPDLIIMGAERKSAVMGEFFSTTTSSVMQLAVGPLMVVPRKDIEN